MKDQYTSYRNIFSIAWPVMLGSLGQNIIYLVDTSFIGRVSEYDLGASAIGGIFYFLIFMIGYAFNTGMQVIVARRKGEGKDAAIGEVVDQQLYLILALGIVGFIVLHFLSARILPMVLHSDMVLERALRFLQYRSYGIVFGLVNSMFMSFFIGIGNTKVTTWTTGVMVAINIFFLSVLVFGKLGFPRMEIAGAGLSSSLAEISVTLVMIFYLFRKKLTRIYSLFHFVKLKLSLISQMIKLSLPLVFQQLISVGSWGIFFLAIEHLGERSLAISNLVRSVYAMHGVPVFALASTANSMTSNLLGQKKPEQVIPLIKKISAISILFAVAINLVILIAPSLLLSIFTNDKGLIADSLSTLYTLMVAILLFSVAIITMLAVSGTGATNVSLRVEIICIIAYLIYVYLTAIKFRGSLPVIWLAEVVYWIVALTLCSIYLMKGNWRTKKV